MTAPTAVIQHHQIAGVAAEARPYRVSEAESVEAEKLAVPPEVAAVRVLDFQGLVSWVGVAGAESVEAGSAEVVLSAEVKKTE